MKLRAREGMAALLLVAATTPVPAAAQAADPMSGSWVMARFLYTNKPPPADAWVAKAFVDYGQKKAFAAPGIPVTYQVFEIVPGAKTIVAIGSGADCAGAANGKDAKLEPTQCRLDTITVYGDGRVDARSSRPGCFLWIDPTEGKGRPDPRLNNTYMRYIAQTGTVQVVTVIGGVPQGGCNVSAHA